MISNSNLNISFAHDSSDVSRTEGVVKNMCKEPNSKVQICEPIACEDVPR